MNRTAFYCVLLSLVASIQDVAALVATAPKVTMSAFEEARPMLIASDLIYLAADILKEAREGDLDLKVPPRFPVKDLSEFADESLDLREYNGKKGLSLEEILDFLEYNREEITSKMNDAFALELLEVLDASDAADKVFLSTVRSIKGDIACVYGVLKDTKNKRVVVSFRGSQQPFANRDWTTNFNARMINMRTPKKIRDKMRGVAKRRVLVHRGFFEYLFNNKELDGQQRYDEICSDIESLMENGYSLYVTGHSLGAALATMFSFKIAGAGASKDWVPRPVSCITYAAPFSGASTYRAAFEQEEIDGLIRSLRINNGEDIVPTVPPISLGARKRPLKHVGINCRLYDGGVKLAHTSQDGLSNGIRNTISNSFLKPIWKGLTWHDLPLHKERMKGAFGVLSKTTIDELYKDDAVVGKDFLSGKVCAYDENEEEDP